MTPLEALRNALESVPVVPLLLLCGLYQVGWLIYELIFSPLSAIPGPWYAAVSDIWLVAQAARLVKCRALHSLFVRYGPIVRVGPRRVVFCDRGAMKKVYCVAKLEKSSFYHAFVADNHDHSMTALTESEHSARRKTFAAHYSPGHILTFQPDIRASVDALVEVLESSPHGSVDCIHLLRHLLVDVIRTTVLGLPPSALENWQERRQDPVCAAVRDFPLRSVWRTAIPNTLWRALAYLPCSRWRDMYDSDDRIASFIKKRLRELNEDADIMLPEKPSLEGPTPLIMRMLRAQRDMCHAEAYGLSEQDIISECMAHMIAGVDTSSVTLGYMLWELSRHPDAVEKMREELDDMVPDSRTFPDYSLLMSSPYFSAFLKEGFRLYGSVSSLLERVVPDNRGGQKTSQGDMFDLMGFLLPSGTIVSTQAWSMHRDPAVFPNPDVFDPERWLDPLGQAEGDPRLTRMSEYMIPFGMGTRACPGRHQTQMIFSLTVAAVVLNFDVLADLTETNEGTMAAMDTFVVRPRAMECRLTFRPRSR